MDLFGNAVPVNLINSPGSNFKFFWINYNSFICFNIPIFQNMISSIRNCYTIFSQNWGIKWYVNCSSNIFQFPPLLSISTVLVLIIRFFRIGNFYYDCTCLVSPVPSNISKKSPLDMTICLEFLLIVSWICYVDSGIRFSISLLF